MFLTLERELLKFEKMTELVNKTISSVVGLIEDERERFHLGKLLMKTLNIFSSKVSQIDVITGNSEKNASILRRSIKLAISLKKSGVKHGDVVMLCAENHFDAGITVVASLMIGAAVLPIDTNLNHVDFKHILNLGEPAVVFCDTTNCLNILENVLKDVTFKSTILTYGKADGKTHQTFADIIINITDQEMDNFKPTDFDPQNTIAFITCTSGSTASPKGVVMTHWAYINRLVEFWLEEEISYKDHVFLSASPLYWISGSAMLLSCYLFGSSRIITSKPFTIEIAFKIMNLYKPTMTLLGPATLIGMINHPDSNEIDWSSFCYILVGGSALSQELKEALQKKLVNGKIMTSYGMSEAYGTIASYVLEPNTKGVPMGPIRSSMMGKIVDLNGTEVKPYENGELWIKSDYIFKEYYRNPTETREAFDKDGWFKTGDIMYYDENKLFYFVDRMKMMIIYKDVPRISPVELENVIATHPSVSMVAVGKLEIPPDDYPVALIIKKPSLDVSPQEIKDLLGSMLAPYKQLYGGMAFVSSLPLKTNGKLDRRAIQEKIKCLKNEVIL